MNCDNCKKCLEDKEIAQIPLISHEYRMYLAHKRERELRLILIFTNAVWVIGTATFLLMR